MMRANISSSPGAYTQLSKQYNRANAVCEPESPIDIISRGMGPIDAHAGTSDTAVHSEDSARKAYCRISGKYYKVEKQRNSRKETDKSSNSLYTFDTKTSASKDFKITSKASHCDDKALSLPNETASLVQAPTEDKNISTTLKSTHPSAHPSNEVDPILPTLNKGTNDFPDGAIVSHLTNSNRSSNRQIHPSEEKNSNHIASEDRHATFFADNYEDENGDAKATADNSECKNYDEEEQQHCDVIDITEVKGNLSQ